MVELRDESTPSALDVGEVYDPAALPLVPIGWAAPETVSYPCRQSNHDSSVDQQFLHHHNHPGLAQWAYWWP
jgi:hypothetical protein